MERRCGIELPIYLMCSRLTATFRCARHIGLFINIRKCTVLYLCDFLGSWHTAPYLDKHGEVDAGLR